MLLVAIPVNAAEYFFVFLATRIFFKQNSFLVAGIFCY